MFSSVNPKMAEAMNLIQIHKPYFENGKWHYFNPAQNKYAVRNVSPDILYGIPMDSFKGIIESMNSAHVPSQASSSSSSSHYNPSSIPVQPVRQPISDNEENNPAAGLGAFMNARHAQKKERERLNRLDIEKKENEAIINRNKYIADIQARDAQSERNRQQKEREKEREKLIKEANLAKEEKARRQTYVEEQESNFPWYFPHDEESAINTARELRRIQLGGNPETEDGTRYLNIFEKMASERIPEGLEEWQKLQEEAKKEWQKQDSMRGLREIRHLGDEKNFAWHASSAGLAPEELIKMRQEYASQLAAGNAPAPRVSPGGPHAEAPYIPGPGIPSVPVAPSSFMQRVEERREQIRLNEDNDEEEDAEQQMVNPMQFHAPLRPFSPPQGHQENQDMMTMMRHIYQQQMNEPNVQYVRARPKRDLYEEVLGHFRPEAYSFDYNEGG